MEAVLLIIVFLILLITIPLMLNKRALAQVIKRFRKHGALNAHSAKSAEELGLQAPSLRDRLLRFRDYKPAALQGLIRVGVVQVTEEGKLYLAEEKLKNTKLANV